MLTVERDGAQIHVKINSSSLSLLQTCPRKSFYTLHEGWRARAGSPPLIYGTAIHKAMEVFYSQPYRGEQTFPENFDEVAPLLGMGHTPPEPHFLYDAIIAFVKAAEPLRYTLPDDNARSIQSGIWVLGYYFKIYLNDIYEIMRDEYGPVVERQFNLPFYEDRRLRISLFGQIDFGLRNRVTDEKLIGDHKTSSRMGVDFFSRIKPNHQYTGYLWAAHQVLGVSEEHFLVNGIQSKVKPKTTRAGPPSFTRQITRRTQEDFNEFQDALLWAVNSYITWEQTGVWPLGTVDACSSWGGCGFLDVCSAPNELRNQILEAKFFKETK
jgi:hypothetical protein